jgi:hypothetical protein
MNGNLLWSRILRFPAVFGNNGTGMWKQLELYASGCVRAERQKLEKVRTKMPDKSDEPVEQQEALSNEGDNSGESQEQQVEPAKAEKREWRGPSSQEQDVPGWLKQAGVKHQRDPQYQQYKTVKDALDAFDQLREETAQLRDGTKRPEWSEDEYQDAFSKREVPDGTQVDEKEQAWFMDVSRQLGIPPEKAVQLADKYLAMFVEKYEQVKEAAKNDYASVQEQQQRDAPRMWEASEQVLDTFDQGGEVRELMKRGAVSNRVFRDLLANVGARLGGGAVSIRMPREIESTGDPMAGAYGSRAPAGMYDSPDMNRFRGGK